MSALLKKRIKKPLLLVKASLLKKKYSTNEELKNDGANSDQADVVEFEMGLNEVTADVHFAAPSER